MKNNLLYILILMIGLAGCDDSFLEIKNEDVIEPEEFIQSKEDVQESLNAAYRALAESNFMGGVFQNMSELMADNIEGRLINNQDWNKHYNRNTDIFTSTTRSMMHQAGKTIGRANATLDYLDDFDFTNEERNSIQGEVFFLRALGHFELVRMFAHPFGFTADNSHNGISIHVEQQLDPVPRSSVAAVYEQIIADLETAISLLPAENGEYATSWAAKGLLAEVYFQMNDFPNAFDMANDVIENGGFQLDSINRRFDVTGSTEAVFSIVGTSEPGFDFDVGSELRAVYRPDNQTRFLLSDAYFLNESAEENDARGAWYDGFNLIKFPEDTRIRVPLIHLTELTLIRAECLAELNTDLQTAIDDLTDIRVRAGLPPVPNASSADDIKEIARRERRFELIGEGNRMHELKRQAVLDQPNLLIRGVPWDCPGMVCQIPDNELAGNISYPPNQEGGCN